MVVMPVWDAFEASKATEVASRAQPATVRVRPTPLSVTRSPAAAPDSSSRGVALRWVGGQGCRVVNGAENIPI